MEKNLVSAHCRREIASSSAEGNQMLRFLNHVRTSHTAEGAVLLDIGNGRIFSLNPTGARVVELLKSGTAESEIPPVLIREFPVDMETAIADTTEFVSVLRRYALVESDV